LLLILDLIALLLLCFIQINHFQVIPAFFENGYYYLEVSDVHEIYYFHQGKMIAVTNFEKVDTYFLVKTEFILPKSVTFYQLIGTKSLLEHLLQILH